MGLQTCKLIYWQISLVFCYLKVISKCSTVITPISLLASTIYSNDDTFTYSDSRWFSFGIIKPYHQTHVQYVCALVGVSGVSEVEIVTETSYFTSFFLLFSFDKCPFQFE